MKLYPLNAMTLSVMKISFNTRITNFIVADYMSNHGHFVVPAFVFLCLGRGANNFSPLHPLRPMVLNYTKRPRPFRYRFSHSTRLSWFLTSLFILSVCFSVISTSKTGTVGSTSSDLSRNKFQTSIPSFANTAISTIAAHLDHSIGNSAEALSQNGLMLNGLFVNSAPCHTAGYDNG